MRLTTNQLTVVRKIASNYAIKVEEVKSEIVNSDMIDFLKRKGAISENNDRLYVCSDTYRQFNLSY